MTIKPAPGVGYELKKLEVTGLSDPIENQDGTYSVTVTAQQGQPTPAISADFQDATKYKLIGNDAGLSFTAGGNVVTEALANTLVTVNVDTPIGKVLDQLTITDGDGNSVILDADNQFTMPASDVTINAAWKQKYTIDTEHESLTFTVDGQSGQTDALPGAEIKVTAAPGEGMALDHLTYTPAGGTPVDITNTQSFEMPEANVTIQAEYTNLNELKVKTISSEDDLYKFARGVNAGLTYEGETVELKADLSIKGSWTAIGTVVKHQSLTRVEHPFCGTFLGNDHVIDLDIRSLDDTIGLFGCLYNGAVVQDLTVTGKIYCPWTWDLYGTLYARGSHSMYLGGIAAYASADYPVIKRNQITNCTSEVDITAGGDCYVGGIVGYGLYTEIVDCQNYGNIHIEIYQRNDNCTNYSLAEGPNSVGGIVGETAGSLISRCINEGNLTAELGWAYNHSSTTQIDDIKKQAAGYYGGLCGRSSSDTVTENSINRGKISGDIKFAGGLSSDSFTGATFTNCYSTGDVASTGDHTLSGFDYGVMSGLVGYGYQNAGKMSNCYSVGVASAEVIGTEFFYVDDITCLKENCSRMVAKNNGILPTENCYGYSSRAIITAELMGDAFKEDATGINNGYPLLVWESTEASDEKQDVTFQVTAPSGAAPTVTLYSDEGRTEEVGSGLTYHLPQGTYYYTVTGSGCVPEKGKISVMRRAVTEEVTLQPGSKVTFLVAPPDAEFTVLYGSMLVEPDDVKTTDSVAEYTYTLYTDGVYDYSAYAEDSNGTSRQFIVTGDASIEVTLTKQAVASGVIYGDRNTVDEDGSEITTHEITGKGIYRIGRGGGIDGEGVITINTTEEVTLVGTGIGTQDIYQDLYINCVKPGTNLTIQDVYISNDAGNSDDKMTNMVNFTGSGNILHFAGTSIMDQNTTDTGCALIHVGPSTSLTITGGEAYIYKYEQGAGIGGNGNGGTLTPEANGTINIQNAVLNIKGNKQGAGIGSGAGASSTGTINISNSTLSVIASARGAAIGGAAGSSGAAPGGNVTITDSLINLNAEWSGAAIGGGGYDGGNDAKGGTLTTSGSSIRAYIGANGTGYWGVSSHGVNNGKAVTATVNGGQYLLTFDTSDLSKAAGSFTVQADGSTIYTGGLHTAGYIGEKTGKERISYTRDNWENPGDTNLYLYVAGKDHTLDVNGEKFTAAWDEKTKTFTVEKSAISTADFVTTVIEEIDGIMTATTTLDSKALAERLKDAEPGAQLDVEPQILGGPMVEKTVLRLPSSDVRAIADSGIILHAGSPVAEITLSNTALKDVAGQGGSEVTISAAQAEKGIEIEVAVDGKAVSSISGGLRVTVPVANPTSSTVLVLVNSNGTQTILNTTVGTDSVSAIVDGSCTVKVVDPAKRVYSTEIKDGIATTTFDSKLLAEYLETLNSGAQLDVVVEASENETITQSVTILSSSDADAIASAKASLRISSPLAGITLSNAALQDVVWQSGKEITITAAQVEKGISIEVAADGTALAKINGGIQVAIPMTNPSQDTVLVLVNADGTETVLETTIGSNYVSATVGGSCIVKVVEKVRTVNVLAATEIEDGKATTTIDSGALAEALKEANASTQLVITVEVPEGEEITQTTTQLTRGDVGAIAETKASLKIATPLGDISLPNKALQDVAGEKGQEEEVVTITASVMESGTRIEIAADGEVLGKIDGGIKASLPVAGEELTPGSVLVLVDGTGRETVIKKSVAGEDNVTGLLDGSCTVKVVDNTKSFQDISGSAWYADAAAFAGSHELFSGVSEGVFDPTGNMTRAMLVTVLHRLEDTPGATTANVFGDVEAGSWYTDAVLWANETGIVYGVSEGVFAPNDSITREQLATFLYRYASVVGLDISARDSLDAFNDTRKISDWASDAMRWAVKTGLITGKGDGILDPGGAATRAEVAAILQRLMNLIVLDEFSTQADASTEYLHPVTTAGGAATATVDSAILSKQLAHSAAGAQITVTAEYPNNIDQAVTVLTRGNAGTVAEAKSSLNVSTPLAGVVLSHEALQALTGQKGQETEEITITTAAAANGTTLEVAANGTVLDKIPGGLLVTLPMDKAELTPGSVLVMVDANGSETILKKSAVGEGGVTALVDGSCTVKVVERTKSFQDVSKTDWYSDAVDFASSHELFSGTSEGVFEPNGEMTRAMLVTVLHRLEDTPDTSAANAFGDVDSNAWYSNAVLWANENNLVNGVDVGVFAPDGNITREQLAAILYRYAGALGLDASARDSLGAYSDTGAVSGWASDAMQWAVGTGLISGKGSGVLDPGGTATRAEAATILQRMVNLITAQ